MCPADIFSLHLALLPYLLLTTAAEDLTNEHLFSLAGYSYFLVCGTVPSIC